MNRLTYTRTHQHTHRTIGTHIQSLVDLKPNKNPLVAHSLLLTVHMPMWLFQCICNRYAARLHKVIRSDSSKHDVFFSNIHAIFDVNSESFHKFSGVFSIKYKIEKIWSKKIISKEQILPADEWWELMAFSLGVYQITVIKSINLTKQYI